jgi:hypothetical protein
MKKNLILLLLAACVSCGPVHDREAVLTHQAQNQESSDCPLKFEKLSLCAQIVPLQSPVRVTTSNQFKLTFWDKSSGGSPSGPYAEPLYSVYVRLWMRMASGDHGSFPVKTNQFVDGQNVPMPGVYDVTQVRFTMAGKWEIQIKLQKNGITVDEVIQYINI